MNVSTFRLVLLVSLAHALVHAYELALPSVEQELAVDYAIGKETIGWLAFCWRMPWGFGALLAGWLVDRFGSYRMLAIYLLGCAATCGAVASQVPLTPLFVMMFCMGAAASIYHPAGLALISHATDEEQRPRALGMHGVFGSAGIAFCPFLVGAALMAGFRWNAYYWFLAAAGAGLGIVVLAFSKRDAVRNDPGMLKSVDNPHADWTAYFLLAFLSLLQGFVYAAMLSFLPRYLGAFRMGDSTNARFLVGQSVMITSGVLLVGCIGQYAAGRLARPKSLERLQTLVMFGNAVCLAWMALATGGWRILAAGVFSLVHFMHQPVYNSLIAKYTPVRRRSLGYGFGLVMSFGVGSLGAVFAGYSQSDQLTYGTLAIVATGAGGVGIVLTRRNALKSA